MLNVAPSSQQTPPSWIFRGDLLCHSSDCAPAGVCRYEVSAALDAQGDDCMRDNDDDDETSARDGEGDQQNKRGRHREGAEGDMWGDTVDMSPCVGDAMMDTKR